MIRKRVLGIGANSATLLVQDTEANGELRVLRRINTAGWDQRDAQQALQMYQTVQRAHISLLVTIHGVLLQNGFLNVITSYCPSGDVSSYVEDDLDGPMPEAKVLQWLLVMAKAVERLRSTASLPFCGLTLERVYLDPKRGASGILVGTPVPLFLYFRILADRKREGMVVDCDYPPEVLQDRRYDPTFSDIWHLGLIGHKLLTAQSPYDARSAHARKLVTQMLEPSLAKRMRLEEVITTLRGMVGDIPTPPPHSSEQILENTENVGRCAAVASPRPAKATTTPPPILGLKHPSNSSTQSEEVNVSKSASYNASSIVNVSETLTPHMRHASATQFNPNADGVPRSARGQRAPPDSWHRRAQEQFEELQRMNASPAKRTSRHVSPHLRQKTPRGSRDSAVLSAPSSPRQVPPQVPLHANPPLQRSMSPKGRSQHHVLDNNTRAFNEMFAEQVEQKRKRERLRQDLEMKRRRQVDGLHSTSVYQQHRDNMRQIRQDDSRQNNIRKHIKEWKKQNDSGLARATEDSNVVVSGGEGVVIVALRSAAQANKTSPAVSESAAQGPLESPYATRSDVPVSIAAPKAPQANFSQPVIAVPEARDSVRANDTITTPLSPHVVIDAVTHPNAAPSGAKSFVHTKERNVVKPRSPVKPLPTVQAPNLSGKVSPPHREPAPRRAIPLKSPAVVPSIPVYRASSPVIKTEGTQRCGAQGSAPDNGPVDANEKRALTPRDSHRFGLSDTSLSSSRGLDGNFHFQNGDATVERHNSLEHTIMLAALEWTVVGLRSAIRSVLPQSALYGATIDLVESFVRCTDEERLNPRRNETFMLGLRELLGDTSQYNVTAPLCAQLAALQGLGRTIAKPLASRAER